MDTAVTIAFITAIIAPALSYYFTKSKEREAEWQRYKFEFYKDLIQSLNGIVGTDSTPEGNRHFAAASNSVHLIASTGVLDALHDFQHEIRASNRSPNESRHNALLSRLEWEIRRDLRIPHNPPLDHFEARLWCSGANSGDTTPFERG